MEKDPYERNDFYEPREAKTPLPRGANSQPMTKENDRLTRIRAGGAIGVADAEWLLGEFDKLRVALERLLIAYEEMSHARACIGDPPDPEAVAAREALGDKLDKTP